MMWKRGAGEARGKSVQIFSVEFSLIQFAVLAVDE